MPDLMESKRGWRRPLVYSIALVVALGSGATTVFLVGSSNRRADRAALVAYERALLPAVREGGRIVEQEMKPTLREIAEGAITPAQLLDRTAAWRRVFIRVRADLLALDPPTLLGAIEPKWGAAMGAYLATVDAFEAVSRADAGGRDAALSRAEDAGGRADDLFDRAAAIVQFHRRRLGLGSSPNLPDRAGVSAP